MRAAGRVGHDFDAPDREDVSTQQDSFVGGFTRPRVTTALGGSEQSRRIPNDKAYTRTNGQCLSRPQLGRRAFTPRIETAARWHHRACLVGQHDQHRLLRLRGRALQQDLGLPDATGAPGGQAGTRALRMDGLSAN